jgi:hypothetical protein
MSVIVFPFPSSLSPSPLPGDRSTEPHRAGGARWDGRASQAARTPRDRSALTRESKPARTGNTPFTPRHTHPCVLACAKEGAAPPRSPERSKPGQLGDFAPPLRRQGSKARGGRQRASRPSYQPHWGFPFPLHLRGRREREEKEASPLRRAEEGRGHTGTPTMCQGRSAPPPRRAGRGRSRERGAGARTGAVGDVRRCGHLLHRERLHCPEHHRHATDDPKPATTTPSPHREHRPTTLLSSPSWSSSCVESANVETCHRYSLA